MHQKKRNQFYILISLFVILAVTLSLGYYWHAKNNPEKTSQVSVEVGLPTKTPILSETAQPKSPSIPPKEFLIKGVSFQPQAPSGDWSEKYNEACEETSIILVKYFYDSQRINATDMDGQIGRLVDWQNENWGGQKNLTVAKTLLLAQNVYGINGSVIKDVTIEDIKEQISNGRPVILPTAGKSLGNPYFRSPGPVYHMVVAIGYTNSTIVVQDVGTKYGENYSYSQTVLFNAIHDWMGDENTIDQGPKNILVLTQ